MRTPRVDEPRAWSEGAVVSPAPPSASLDEMWDELAADMTRTSWIGPSVMTSGAEVAAPLAAAYWQLRRLPRRVRRALGRRGAFSLASVALALALSGAQGEAGTTISVATGNALASAITLANSQTG